MRENQGVRTHIVHCAISIATLVMTAKILHKVCHLRAALRDFKKGEEELEK